MRRVSIVVDDLRVNHRILSGDELSRVVSIERHPNGSVTVALVSCDEMCDTYPDEPPYKHAYPAHYTLTILEDA